MTLSVLSPPSLSLLSPSPLFLSSTPLLSPSSLALLSYSSLPLLSYSSLSMTRKGVRNGLGLVFAYAGTYKPDRLLRALHLFRHERVAKKT